jgi:hypothetical protein
MKAMASAGSIEPLVMVDICSRSASSIAFLSAHAAPGKLLVMVTVAIVSDPVRTVEASSSSVIGSADSCSGVTAESSR